MRGRAVRMGTMLGLAAGALAAGCDTPTDPPIASGTVSLVIAPASMPESPETWTATGSCGAPGFVLGAQTCAFGAAEPQYWLALGVVAYDDGTYDTVGMAHPLEAGTCEASAAQGTTCTVEVRRGWPGEQGPPALYLLSSGTVTADTATVDGVLRVIGTFEGTATNVGGAGEALVITEGSFDVELTD